MQRGSAFDSDLNLVCSRAISAQLKTGPSPLMARSVTAGVGWRIPVTEVLRTKYAGGEFLSP